MTPEDLIAFEAGFAGIFNVGKIRAPIHPCCIQEY
jgi:hypothetical protein